MGALGALRTGRRDESTVSAFGDTAGGLFSSAYVGARLSRLSFYATHRLMELRFASDNDMKRVFVLASPADTRWLNGSSNPIHGVNESEPIDLSEHTVVDYLRFFFYFVHGDDAFVLIESPDGLGIPTDLSINRIENREGAIKLEEARRKVKPLILRSVDTTDWWLADATVAFQGVLFVTSVAVRSDGSIEMIEDEPVVALDGIAMAEMASLEMQRAVNESVVPTPDLGLDLTDGSQDGRWALGRAAMAEFVGGDRRQLVDSLVVAFDSIVQVPGPQMVVLSAPSGEGKTRIIQEFYRRIAASQPTPAYWPAEIVAEDVDDWKNDRKRLAVAAFTPASGANIPWLYWSVSCRRRSDNTPAQALFDDQTQFQAHAEPLFTILERREFAGKTFDGVNALLSVLGILVS